MPRALKVNEVASRFFPALTLLFVDDDPVPELSEATHAEILKLNILAWQLKRAKMRESAASNRAKALRETILNRIGQMKDIDGKSFNLYGFRARRTRGTETKFTPQHSSEIVNNQGFLDYLGSHTPEVITGFQLSLDKIIKSQGDFARLMRAISDEFGDEAAEAIKLLHSRDRLNELINKEKVLDDPPEGIFEETVGSVQVRVTILDPTTQVKNASKK